MAPWTAHAGTCASEPVSASLEDMLEAMVTQCLSCCRSARRWLQNPTFWRFARKRWTKDNVASSLRQHSTVLKRYILQRRNDGSVLPIETENGCGRGCVLAVVSLMDCDKNPVRFWSEIEGMAR